MLKTVTVQGDMWDVLAKRLYGDALLMHVLIAANPAYRKMVIFPAGIEINVPEVEASSSQYEANMPPWKRNEE